MSHVFVKPQPYAYWLRTHRAQFKSLSEFRAWQRDRNARWREANPRKHRAQLANQKIYQRRRMARLRGLVMWEIIRRIGMGTPVTPATNVTLKTTNAKTA
jgi:hypothetical protein